MIIVSVILAVCICIVWWQDKRTEMIQTRDLTDLEDKSTSEIEMTDKISLKEEVK